MHNTFADLLSVAWNVYTKRSEKVEVNPVLKGRENVL